MQMDAGLDTGDMLLVEKTPIAPTDTTAVLHDRLAELGGRMIVEALELAACGGLQPVPQPAEGVTYAHKIEKAESEIDWSLPAHVIGQRIRAFDPFPGASTALQGEAIKVWGYEIDSCSRLSNERCGQILASGPEGVTVACGEGGALRLAVRVSEAAKCARCWHHRPDVGSHAAHPELCGRCVENVDGAGEVRGWF